MIFSEFMCCIPIACPRAFITIALQNKEMPALKTASVSEITAGNKDTFVAAEKGVSLKPEEKEPLKVGEQAEAQQMGDLIDQLIDPVESQQPQASCWKSSLS